MATKAELVYNIADLIRGGTSNNDDPVSLEQIAFQVDYYRALLVKRDIDKKKGVYGPYNIDPSLLQSICLTMELVDRSLCPDEVTLDCNILRSTQPIPKAITTIGWNGIVFLGSVDGGINYQQTTSELAHWQKFARHTSQVNRYFLVDQYAYIPFDLRIRYLHCMAAFENPEEASHFSWPDGSHCHDLDDDYPIPLWMVQPLTELLLMKEYNIVLRTGTDTLNDRTIEVPQPGLPGKRK